MTSLQTIPRRSVPVQGGAAVPDRRADVQGLRTIAALLVACYHIWTHRVSGAVDVFFVVSAFVMTQSLVRSIRATGGVRVGRFLRDLLFRMAPLAWTVVGVTALAGAVLLPATEWPRIGEQALAAALFAMNQHLGLESIAYLGAEADSSLFQHFWAMSVQVQFYLLFPFLGVLAVVTGRRIRRDPTAVLACLMAVVLVASFLHAWESVHGDQASAYFDTAARAWQFAAGSLAALAVPHLRVPARVARVAVWTGLLVLVGLGAAWNMTGLFPGPAALVPVGAALLILVCGAAAPGNAVLTWRPVVRAAEYSFAFYLWHWPVLVLVRQLTGVDRPDLLTGLAIITAAAVLAVLTALVVERPLRARHGAAGARSPWPALAGIGLVAVLTIAGVHGAVAHLRAAAPTDNPGAAVLAGDAPDGLLLDVQPALVDLTHGQWEEWGQDCTGVEQDGAEVYVECSGGADDAPISILALGDSHTVHWLTVFADAVAAGDVRLTSIYRGSCPLSTTGWDKLGDGHDEVPLCEAANRERIDRAIATRPDLVVTVGNIAREGAPDVVFTDGFVDAVTRVSAEGIPVAVIRDQPRHVTAFADCLAANGLRASACAVPAETVLADLDFETALPSSLRADPLVSGLDATDLLCVDGVCPAVIGGVILYSDTNHMTRDYVATAAPYFLERLRETAARIGVALL